MNTRLLNNSARIPALRYSLFAGLLMVSCLLLTPVSQAAKLYKWVDAEGNVSYQDQPPPEGGQLLEESELQTAAQETTEGLSPVLVYTVADCDRCELVLVRLRQLAVPTQEQSLLDREIQSQILNSRQTLAAPTLRIGNKFVSDISEANLVKELTEAGYLQAQQEPERERVQEEETDPNLRDPRLVQ